MSDVAAWLNFQGAHKESGEALWYRSYTDEPTRPGRESGDRSPICNRLSRLPRIDQLGMAIDLAADVWTGDAIYRGCADITVTGEEHWFWPGCPAAKYASGWWMLPARTARLARRALEHAMAVAARAQHRRCWIAAERGLMATWTPLPHADAVLIELRRLQRRARLAVSAARSDGYVPEYWRSPLPPLPAPQPGRHIDYCEWPEWARPPGAVRSGSAHSAYAPASRAWTKFTRRCRRRKPKDEHDADGALPAPCDADDGARPGDAAV